MAKAIDLMPSEKIKGWFLAHASIGDGCWDWQRTINWNGYGWFRLKGKCIIAHRFSYKLFAGDIPDKLQVLHHCDNRKCIRPDHLFLGTEHDNGKDAAIKDRRRKKLTADQVREIRELLLSGMRQKQIAENFNVRRQTISQIHVGKRRQYVS